MIEQHKINAINHMAQKTRRFPTIVWQGVVVRLVVKTTNLVWFAIDNRIAIASPFNKYN